MSGWNYLLKHKILYILCLGIKKGWGFVLDENFESGENILFILVSYPLQKLVFWRKNENMGFL